MPFERPTFHEAWYRVEGMHPRIRSTVQITRQHFRNQAWYVVQDHTNNVFFRITEPAYYLLGLLDGRRTVGEAWKLAMEQLGDDAPTQPETIQLLGQLYTSNLLQAEMAADTHGLFNRYKKRRQREIQSYLMNLMFIRLPILDPDAFLERWMPVFGWIFGPVGMLVWSILVGIGIYFLTNVTNWTEKVVTEGRGVLAPENILLMYLCFAATKACHEFGHAISCKKFGLQSGVGGEVHAMGIMFLVFSPVPYVDASSSWALQSKWHRIIVSAAGMWVELAIAAVAAVVWAQTGAQSTYHQLAYNVMFIASFSTIVFNANPLLRYDGYYMLSDLLEIPNLAQRSKEFWYYLVKRYAWGLKQARNPAYSTGEEAWMFFYAIASGIMRVVVSIGILLYLASVLQGILIFIAVAMALAGVITWVAVPIVKFAHYLLTSHELMRVRTRAIATTAVAVGALVGGLGLLPWPDRARAQGIVDADATGLAALQDLNAGGDGVVVEAIDPRAFDHGWGTGQYLVEKGTTVLRAHNPELEAQLASSLAERETVDKRYKAAVASAILDSKTSFGLAQGYARQLADWDKRIRYEQEQLDELTVKSPMTGVLVVPDLEHIKGTYVKRGDKIGFMIDPRRLVVIATVPNEFSALVRKEGQRRVEIRVQGDPDQVITGTFGENDIAPAGRKQLRTPALGYLGGGMTPVTPGGGPGKQAKEEGGDSGTVATNEFFEVRVRLDPDAKMPRILPGQRVMVKFSLAPKPIAVQVWTKVQQLVMNRFGI